MSSIDVLSGLRIKKRRLVCFLLRFTEELEGRWEGCFEGVKTRKRGAGLTGWMFRVNNRLAVVAPRALGGVGGGKNGLFCIRSACIGVVEVCPGLGGG